MNKRRTRSGFGGVAIILGVLGATACAANAAEVTSVVAVGKKVPNSRSLRDLRGNQRPLYSFSDYRAVVLVFTGTQCPIANVYVPSLIKFEKQYRSKRVQFLAVYPNEHENLDQVAAHSYARDIPFLVLKDYGQRLADAVGVKRTPEIVVLDGDFVLRYRGRIDDRYGVAYRRNKATREDLIVAIDEVLAGKKVSVPETEADGCLIDRGKKQSKSKDITYSKQVARILQKRCQTCHRPDQAAPFSLLTYDDAVRWSRMIKEVTTQRRMPPWHADPRFGKFSNDRSMTAKEIDAVVAWVDSGTPRGNEKEAPAPIDWPEGWTRGKPDQVFTMAEEFKVPADGALSYKYWTIPTNFTEDRWVQMAEGLPGAASVVHHIIAYILPPGQRRAFRNDGTLSVLAAWAPGDLGMTLPPGTALRVPKGSQLRFEMHYTPNGTAVADRSSVGVWFAKKPPEREIMVNAFINEAIRLPPHAPHHREEATLRFQDNARIISLLPHMHWRGKSYHYEAIYPDGHKKVLLSVPRWDFNWQNQYYFDEPLHVPKGTRLHAVAHWDNSRNNLSNPDPSKVVRFGLQTWDEMMVGWVTYVWERPGIGEQIVRKRNPADQFFDRLDRNGDDVISPKEIPDQARPFLERGGLKLPDPLTRDAFRTYFEELTKRFRRGGSDRSKKAAKSKEPASSNDPGSFE